LRIVSLVVVSVGLVVLLWSATLYRSGWDAEGQPAIETLGADLAGLLGFGQSAALAPALRQEPVERTRARLETVGRELAAARRELQAVQTEALKSQDLAEEGRRQTGEERARSAALQEELGFLRRQIDALKTNAERGREREEHLIGDLTVASKEVERLRGVVEDAHDAVGHTATALDEQRQLADGLAHDLVLARAEIDRLTAKVDASRMASQASQTELMQGLGEEHRKSESLRGDLAAARQIIAVLNGRVEQASTEHTAAEQARRVAEDAAREARGALAAEQQRTASIVQELEDARRDREAMRKVWEEVGAALKDALDSERETAVAFAWNLMAARQQVDWLTLKLRRTQIDTASKPRVTRPSAAQVKATTKKAAGGVARRPSSTPRVTAIALPEALLPTRVVASGLRQ
jgi:chromosome segregation ATPase